MIHNYPCSIRQNRRKSNNPTEIMTTILLRTIIIINLDAATRLKKCILRRFMQIFDVVFTFFTFRGLMKKKTDLYSRRVINIVELSVAWFHLVHYIWNNDCCFVIVIYENIHSKDLDRTRLAKGTRHSYTKELYFERMAECRSLQQNIIKKIFTSPTNK